MFISNCCAGYWTSWQMSWDCTFGALLLLGQLGLDLTGELVEVLVHTLHAESLGVEKTAVLPKEKVHISTWCATLIFFYVYFLIRINWLLVHHSHEAHSANMYATWLQSHLRKTDARFVISDLRSTPAKRKSATWAQLGFLMHFYEMWS